jgi:hypothetical protein
VPAAERLTNATVDVLITTGAAEAVVGARK